MDISDDMRLFSKTINRMITKHKKYSKKEYRFYKRRIFQLFKDIMSKKETDETMIEAYDSFVSESIKYLKFKDKASILQEEYEDLSLNAKGSHCFNTLDNSLFDSVSYSNHMLMKDYNVKTASVIDTLGVQKINKNPKKLPVLPISKHINIQDPKFKVLGVRSKKNLHNKYEDKDGEDKEENKYKNKTPDAVKPAK